MTELEIMIYNTALPIIKRLKRQSKWKKGIESRYIEIPFICEGVFDKLIFDREINDFIEIRYSKGIGKGVGSGMSNYSAYFDKTETKIIKLSL
jgi:hypothetical protein